MNIGIRMALREYPGVKQLLAAKERADLAMLGEKSPVLPIPETSRADLDAIHAKKVDDEKVYALFLQGFNFPQIADYLNLSMETVYLAWQRAITKQ